MYDLSCLSWGKNFLQNLFSCLFSPSRASHIVHVGFCSQPWALVISDRIPSHTLEPGKELPSITEMERVDKCDCCHGDDFYLDAPAQSLSANCFFFLSAIVSFIYFGLHKKMKCLALNCLKDV